MNRRQWMMSSAVALAGVYCLKLANTKLEVL